MNNINDNELRRAFRVAVILGVAVIGSLFVSVLVVEYLKANYHSVVGFVSFQYLRSLRYIAYALSIIHAFILRIIRGFLFRKLPVDNRAKLIGRLSQISIISVILCEGPGFYGFVFFFLSGISRDFYLLMAVSIILLFMYFPRLKNWQYWLQRLEIRQ